MDKEDYAIGIDIGGTKINIGVINCTGELKDFKQIATQVEEGPQRIIQDIEKGIKTLLSSHSFSPSGIGIGIAGQIDPTEGVIKTSPNLKWFNVPLKAELVKSLDLPVIITNDVRAATWAEWLYGEGKNSDNLVCLFVGTGIGSGIVVDGKVLNGASNTAGEIGHITIDRQGDLCSCGNKGCWEVYAAGWGIAHQAKKKLKNFTGESAIISKGLSIQQVTAKNVIEAYKQNDPLAQEIIQQVSDDLVLGTVNVINFFNPEKVILGGGIINALPNLVDYIAKEIPQRAIKVSTQHAQIVKAKFLSDAGMIGAGALALNAFSKTALKIV